MELPVQVIHVGIVMRSKKKGCVGRARSKIKKRNLVVRNFRTTAKDGDNIGV